MARDPVQPTSPADLAISTDDADAATLAETHAELGIIWVDSDVVGAAGEEIGNDAPGDCMTRVAMFFPQFFRGGAAGG